jgi:hypothetical protein
MGALGSFLVAGLTVLLVMSLAAVITSDLDAVRSDPSVLDPLLVSPTGQPEATASPAAVADLRRDTDGLASDGDAQVIMPNGARPPQVRGGPPWAPAPKPPGLYF